MSDQTPPAETPTDAPQSVEQPKAERWYRTDCWPSADRAGVPVRYVKRHASAADALKDAQARIDSSRGAGTAEKWTFTVGRTTKPKDAPSGGDPEPLADG